MFKKLFLFLCFICALFMQINYGNAIGIDEINDNNVADFIKARKETIDKIYGKGKDFFSYDNLNNCIGDVIVNIKAYKKYTDETNKTLSSKNKDELKKLISKEETLRNYCRQNLSIITGVNDGSGFSSNGMLRGMCFVLSILRGNYAKTIAALFVIGLGFLMLFGNLKFTSYMFFVIALALAFGADQVANVISGNTFSCSYINTSYQVANEIKCPIGSYYKNGRCAFTSCSNLVNTYLDTNFSSTSTSVNNGKKVYKECGVGKYGYIEYICKDGELDYNLDTCYTPGNYCTAGTLPIMSGANFNLSGMTIGVGTIVESTCAEGYLGTAKIICQKDKTWKVENSCKVDISKYCNTSDIYTNLGGIDGINSKHIKLNISKVEQEQAVNPGKTDIDIGISCDIGYKGNVNILCGTNKKWFIDGTCTIIKCPTAYNLSNGKYSITDKNNTYKSEITGVCNTGYVGTPKVICGLDGNWSVLSGSCTPDKEFCSTLSVENGVVDNRRIFGSYATLKCNNGYESSGKKALLCTKDGTWDDEFGKCELSLNYCGKIDSMVGVDKIEYIDGNRALGSRMKITCKDKYMLKGNNVLKCQSDKTWSLTSGTCELISCFNLAPAENVSEWYGNIATKDQEVYGVCKKGYTGKPKATCNGDGQWEITNNCAVNMHYCGSLLVANGGVNYSNKQAAGSEAILTCNTGYELFGKSSVSCDVDKDGLWSDKIGSCQKVRCPTSLALSNGKYTITNDNNKFGDKVVGNCNSGYVGEPVATCNADKTWSTTGSCELVECNGLDKVNPHSEYGSTTTAKYGASVKGTCEIGYKGNPIASCQADGTWSIKDDCQLDTEFCSEIDARNDTYITYKGNGRALGSKAILTCGTGFKLVGNDVATCSKNKQWEASLGSCELITNFCTTFNAVKNGTIKYTKDYTFKSKATLICETGYRLKGNEDAECISNENSSENGKGEWNRDLGVCEKKENYCSSINVENGSVSYGDSYSKGSVATLQCNIGYEIDNESSGSVKTTCIKVDEENGKWDNELKSCKLIKNYCPEKVVDNGVITYLNDNKFAYDSSITLECNTGYSLSGISSANCQANKKWTELGTCEIIHCPITTLTVENGTYDEITAENNAYNKTISGTCKTGYTGDLKATCDKNGNWVLSGSCKIVNCGNLNIGNDSTNWNATGTSYGKSVYGTCKTGYITDCIDNSKTNCDRWQPMVRCESVETNGVSEIKWNLINKCNKIMTFCPELSDDYGKYSYSEERALGSKATLECDEGYEPLNGLNEVICQEDESWDKSIKCEIKVCENLQEQPEQHIASWAATKAEWNTEVDGTCEEDYTGSPTATCLNDKTWGIKSDCTLKTCSNPIIQGHIASWDETKTNIHETITGKCEVGYKGTPTAECVDQDKWEYNDNCEIMTCNDPELIGNIESWSSTTTTYDTPIYGICIEGYEGKPKANCNAEEKWEIVDNCKPKVCSNLEEQAKAEKQEGIKSWSDTTAAYNQEEQITGVCAKGYTGTATAICKADQTWDIKNDCKKIKNYCSEITTRNGTITYADGQTIGSVATLTCSGDYDTLVGEKEVKCITDSTKKDDDKGKWDKELGDCGVVVEFYSPRNDVAKEKTFKKGDVFACSKQNFDDNTDIDPNVVKLCRIKGSKQYFGHEGDSYILTDDLLSQKDPDCHIAYVNRDLGTISELSTYDFKENKESKLYDGTSAYKVGGLVSNSESRVINCASKYAGKPEIVCKNGKWTWNSIEGTDNYCYKDGCDITDYAVAEKNLVSEGWGLETKSCSTNNDTNRKIIPNGSWISAKCQEGYVSNFDNPVECNKDLAIARQKSVFGQCVNGTVTHQPANGKKHGDACVPGCVYGDKDNGWIDEMLQNTDTDGDYVQHNISTEWGNASVGKYAVRIDTKINKGALIYRNCATGYSVDNSSQTDKLTYPVVQCGFDGKWSKYDDYKMRCDIISGCTEFAFHKEEQYLNVPSTGLVKIKMQVWGAQGGVRWNGTKNAGGYGYGELDSIAGGKKVRVRVGQYGGTIPVIGVNPMGSGEGGRITNKCYGDTTLARAGGGGTKVWMDNGFRLQAGGGGGDGNGNNEGAAGGGANKAGDDTWLAFGGTLEKAGDGCGNQAKGYGSGENGGWNDGNSGNNNMSCGGGGGGGYYGGGGCGYTRRDNADHAAGGGGGSGYASSEFKNVQSVNGAKYGNGFVRICWGDNTNCDNGSGDGDKSTCDVTYSNKFSNAVEIHYGEGSCESCWQPGFFRYGFTGSCTNNEGLNSDGNWGDPRPNKTKSCMAPNGFHQYAGEGSSFTAWP